MKGNLSAQSFGAVGDGVTDETVALQSCIDQAVAQGGGMVVLGPGVHRSGPLSLGSGVELRLESGATLSFIPDFSRYPPVRTRWEGVECWAMHPLLFASGAAHVTLSGEGTLDGNGPVWWDDLRALRAAGRSYPERPFELELASLNKDYRSQASGGGGRETQFLRPPLVQFIHCTDVRIEGLRLGSSPFWNTHLVYCGGVTVRGVLFKNPPNAPNTDGLDIDSCVDVTVEDCVFDVGDDCLCLKSGSGEDGVRVNRPTERVTVRGCTLLAGHGGVVIGSETAGGVRDVEISHCRFLGTDRGLRIKTRRGRGGAVENIALRDCSMEGTLCPVVINCYYGPGGPPSDSPTFSIHPQEITPTTPYLGNIVIERLVATGCRSAAAFVVGLPERPIQGLVIRDSSFSVEASLSPDEAAMARGLPSSKGRGLRLRNVRDLSLENLRISPKEAAEQEAEEGVTPVPPPIEYGEKGASMDQTLSPLQWSGRFVDTVVSRNAATSYPWHYETGLILMSLWEYERITHDEGLREYLRSCGESLVEVGGTIRGYSVEEYNLDQVATGKILLELAEAYGQDRRYAVAVDTLRKQLSGQPRVKAGGFWHKKIYPYQMWLDGLYMQAPFSIRYGLTRGDGDLVEDAISQLLLVEEKTRDPESGLLHHAWDESRKQPWANPDNGRSPHAWGRAMGWYAMALVDCYALLPAGHPGRESLVPVLRRLAKAIEESRDAESGIWLQLLDQGGRLGNYPETSASAMFCYSLAKAVRLGLLPPSPYGDLARSAYDALVARAARINADGSATLSGICKVAGLGGTPYRDGSFSYYVGEPVGDDDFKGLGPFILAGLELR